jgi:hypothetical protein
MSQLHLLYHINWCETAKYSIAIYSSLIDKVKFVYHIKSESYIVNHHL